MKVSNHLKFIANEFPVTLVLVGVGLTEAGLFTEGRTQRESTLAQTARRTTRLTMEPFANTTAGQKQWRSVLHAIEQRVVLVKHREGTLSEQLADYLYARTSGHIGSLMTLINRASSRAIRTGTEALTEQILEALKNAPGGWLPFGDHSRPEDIRAQFGASKKAFKQAIGALYRQRQIRLREDGIALA